VRLRSGHEIVVDVHDHDGRVLHIFGTGDIKVGELTQSLLREGDCFLDIGANYGSIGLAASGAVGVEGPVHLFEPQPPLATAIRKAIDGDALPQRLHLHQAAVSDRAGQLNLYCAPHHTGLASLSPDPTRRRDWNAIEVAVLDIYSVLQQHVAPRDFGVKLDIEGHEPKVLPAILDDPGCRFAITEACSNAEEIFTLRGPRFSDIRFGEADLPPTSPPPRPPPRLELSSRRRSDPQLPNASTATDLMLFQAPRRDT
jgi:FkbM family methyltransferase